MKKTNIPVFFAVDENYIDYLAITIKSIMDNAIDEHYNYTFIILHKGLKREAKKVLDFAKSKRFKVIFFDIMIKLNTLEKRVSLRDYYTMAIFYRIIIPDTFFWLDKAIYLDCDIVLKDDLSRLYKTELGENLLAAVSEQSVQITPEFIAYVEKSLGVKKEEYFNSGVLLMNLKEMRKFHLFKRMIMLSKTAVFKAAPDQDMLNIICNKRVKYLSSDWNTIPMTAKNENASLIHYIHIFKPWKRIDVQYADLFWNVAKKLGIDKRLEERRKSITEDMLRAEEKDLQGLLEFTQEESNHPERYEGARALMDDNDPYFNISLDKSEMYEKMDKLEREKKFNDDINDDPPYRVLTAGMVDYKKKKFKTKILSWFYNRYSYKYFTGLQKKGQIIIDRVIGVENIQNLKEGAIITANHFSPFDSIPLHIVIRKNHFRKWCFVVVKEGNYSYPGLYGKFMRYCNSLPLSSNYGAMREMFDGLHYWLNKGYPVIIYPEQSMWWNYRKPRPTKIGAFQMAAKNNCPIVPTFITMEDTGILNSDTENIQKYILHISSPIYPKPELSEKENAQYLKEENDKVWKNIYESTYKMPLTYKEGDGNNL